MRKILHVMPLKVDDVRKKKVKSFLKRLSFKDTLVDILDFDKGPVDLEYCYSEHKAIKLMLEGIPKIQKDYDAILLLFIVLIYSFTNLYFYYHLFYYLFILSFYFLPQSSKFIH